MNASKDLLHTRARRVCTCRAWLLLHPLFSAYSLLGAYLLTTYTYKRIRLLTRVYGICAIEQCKKQGGQAKDEQATLSPPQMVQGTTLFVSQVRETEQSSTKQLCVCVWLHLRLLMPLSLTKHLACVFCWALLGLLEKQRSHWFSCLVPSGVATA